MEPQQSNLKSKFSLIWSKNSKIIILGVFVFLLIGITIFSNVYGSISRSSEKRNLETDRLLSQDVNLGDDSTVTSGSTGYLDEAPVAELLKFFKLLRNNKVDEASGSLSDLNSKEKLKHFMEGVVRYKNNISFTVFSVKYSENKDYAYVGVEITVSQTKTYWDFTMVKIDSQWKVYNGEVLKTI